MADPQRPTFFEGQVLAAADLTAIVDHARTHAARHDRYLHDWGIAEGLTLTAEPRSDPDTNAAYVAVTLQPGMAIDGTGREVLVTSPVPLSEALFQEVNGADPVTPAPQPYPVFLAGLDRDPASTPVGPDTCSPTGQRTRVDESYQIVFGRLGDEQLVAEQRPPAVGDGPGDGRSPWLILLGFVTWRPADGRFTSVVPKAGKVSPRYAGVRADTVSARSGALALRAQPAAAEGAPVVTLDRANGLAFGLYKGDGTVNDLLVVSPRGDLTVRGTVSGAQRSGEIAVVSGVATDGMLLPLPAGVSEDQVSSGRILLHIWLRTHLTGGSDPAGEVWVTSPFECSVGPQRRVRSRVRSVRVDELPPRIRYESVPADFLVLATVAADPNASGGTS
jgi:hypothetical protein